MSVKASRAGPAGEEEAGETRLLLTSKKFVMPLTSIDTETGDIMCLGSEIVAQDTT
jgi:hypothetical protein